MTEIQKFEKMKFQYVIDKILIKVSKDLMEVIFHENKLKN